MRVYFYGHDGNGRYRGHGGKRIFGKRESAFRPSAQWGDDFYTEDWAWGRKMDEFGTLHHLRLLEDKPDFQTMVVVFGEPISQIDRSVFKDADTWGVCSLQGWVNSYESVRFVAINDHTAVITGEYNFEQVKAWLKKYVPIQSLKIS